MAFDNYIMNQIEEFEQLKQHGHCIRLINNGTAIITLKNGNTHSDEFLKYKLINDDPVEKDVEEDVEKSDSSSDETPKKKSSHKKNTNDNISYTYDNVNKSNLHLQDNELKKKDSVIVFVWKNPVKNMTGTGVLQFANKFEYKGDILDGNMTGQCVITRKNNEKKIVYKYEGSIVNALYDGHGHSILYDINGDISNVYIGNYKNHKYHGKGVLTTESSVYDGEFEKGLKCGNGLEKMTTGITFNGKFENDIFCSGVLTKKNGDIYKGTFNNDMLYGIGELKLKNGNTYNGKFVKNKLNGIGKLTMANGDTYEGKFTNDKKNGSFTIVYHDGKSELVSYSNDIQKNMKKITNMTCPICKIKIDFYMNTFTNSDATETCCICYEQCKQILSCGHFACSKCIDKLKNIKKKNRHDSDSD